MLFYGIMLGYFLLRWSYKAGLRAQARAQERAWERACEASKKEAEQSYDNFQRWRAERKANMAQEQARPPSDRRLKVLGLNRMPINKEELKMAWRSAIKKHHPDLGLDLDPRLAMEINAAYTSLESLLDNGQTAH